MAKLAKESKLATQMGTQIHATDNYRRVVELVRSGAIGPVKEVHVWCNGKPWSDGKRATVDPARPQLPELGPLARPGARTALPPVLPACQLAETLGLRQRDPRRHGLPRR